tara:strand:+ start:8993 stop:9898 length:906 start_codon:yes stop_codon:yes gene_type:complete
MGGTRFIGRSLVKILLSKGHELTLFTRGHNLVPDNVHHLVGDRRNNKDLEILSGKTFDVIIDSSGRTLEDTSSVISHTGYPNFRFIYISSAGVYMKSEILPVNETFSIDHQSRHIGKSKTENWLIKEGIPFTSFRPTYIYGPGNYNPIEKWFFDRIIYKKAIPLPGDGQILTQLGHVYDLANAISLSLDSKNSNNKIYNCSGKKAITFKGLIHIAAKAANFEPEDVNIRYFNFSNLDSKARKAFPLRLEHFYTDTNEIENDLNWREKFDLEAGFKDSYLNDYSVNNNVEPDFSADDKLCDV